MVVTRGWERRKWSIVVKWVPHMEVRSAAWKNSGDQFYNSVNILSTTELYT